MNIDEKLSLKLLEEINEIKNQNNNMNIHIKNQVYQQEILDFMNCRNHYQKSCKKNNKRITNFRLKRRVKP